MVIRTGLTIFFSREGVGDISGVWCWTRQYSIGQWYKIQRVIGYKTKSCICFEFHVSKTWSKCEILNGEVWIGSEIVTDTMFWLNLIMYIITDIHGQFVKFQCLIYLTFLLTIIRIIWLIYKMFCKLGYFMSILLMNFINRVYNIWHLHYKM